MADIQVRMRRVLRRAAAATVASLSAVALALVAGCASAGTGVSPDDLVVLPSGSPQVMAASRTVGGFVPPGWTFIEAPRVVVYSDGRAIADARRMLVLSPTEVADLVRALRLDLRGFGPTATTPEGQFVADAPSTVLQVRTATGLQSVEAYALGIVEGYPHRLVAAQDRLETLAQRVVGGGGPYRADRVRLVAEERFEADRVRDWPAEVPLPTVNAMGVRVADLGGVTAIALVGAIPQVGEESGVWPVLRLPDGSLVGVAWRYLLPDE